MYQIACIFNGLFVFNHCLITCQNRSCLVDFPLKPKSILLKWKRVYFLSKAPEYKMLWEMLREREQSKMSEYVSLKRKLTSETHYTEYLTRCMYFVFFCPKRFLTWDNLAYGPLVLCCKHHKLIPFQNFWIQLISFWINVLSWKIGHFRRLISKSSVIQNSECLFFHR